MDIRDIDYEDLKNSYIERELEQRVNAIKLLNTSFSVDDVSFSTRGYAPALQVIGYEGFDKLAHIVDKEVYDTIINEKNAEAFEYNGIEVYRYV